ncbi:MAG: AbrB/MazE/SpoVT family DNA-binding domain-containing protein [Terracidiphilus sp.]
MPTAMVTFNGRITLPSEVRKELGLKTGDSVEFVEVEKGRFAICPPTHSRLEMERRQPTVEFVPTFRKKNGAIL